MYLLWIHFILGLTEGVAVAVGLHCDFYNGKLPPYSFGPDTTRSSVWLAGLPKCFGTITSRAKEAVAAGVPLKYPFEEINGLRDIIMTCIKDCTNIDSGW